MAPFFCGSVSLKDIFIFIQISSAMRLYQICCIRFHTTSMLVPVSFVKFNFLATLPYCIFISVTDPDPGGQK
jgi:hypothetical protein